MLSCVSPCILCVAVFLHEEMIACMSVNCWMHANGGPGLLQQLKCCSARLDTAFYIAVAARKRFTRSSANRASGGVTRLGEGWSFCNSYSFEII